MSRCLSIEELAQLEQLGTEARDHAETCPRCSMLQRESREFQSGTSNVSSRDLADAEARLAGFLEREVGAARSPGAASRVDDRPATWLETILAWLRTPAARPAFGAAFAVALIAAFAVVSLRSPAVRHDAEPLLRGESEVRGPGAPLTLTARASRAGDALDLHWVPAAGADAYRLELLSAELDPLETFGPLREPRFSLARGVLQTPASGAEVYARVVALHAGAPLAESELATIRLP